MHKKISYPYDLILKQDNPVIESVIVLQDHLNGFDINGHNQIFKRLNQLKKTSTVIWHEVLDTQVKLLYPNLQIKFNSLLQNKLNLTAFANYRQHPELTFQNFLCSFNGSPHVSRKLLVSILNRFNWFNSDTCSKNFAYTVEQLDGHVLDYTNSQHSFYYKFFIAPDSQRFFQSTTSFGHVRSNHNKNIYNIENKLTKSFLHIVSETMATSYCPFVTEKFLYSVVTRGLFLAYAQPGWHQHLEKYYGFKRYNKLFDYRFDAIQNPVERLVELITMLSKFSLLSTDDWRDLYLLQQDEIEYNYDHYFSGNYLTMLQKYE